MSERDQRSSKEKKWTCGGEESARRNGEWETLTRPDSKRRDRVEIGRKYIRSSMESVHSDNRQVESDIRADI